MAKVPEPEPTAPAPPPPPAAPGPIKAFDGSGGKVLVTPDQVQSLYASGGRLATPQEIAKSDLDKQYSQASLGDKALGLAQYAGPAGTAASLAARALGANPIAPPEVEAIHQGQVAGVTGGLGQAVAYEGLKHLDPKAAAEYKDNLEKVQTAHEGLYNAAQVGGMVGTMFMGGEGLAAKLVPGAAIGEAGAAANQLVAKQLVGLASKGAVGEAARAGLSLGAQGAVEGALWNAAHEASQGILADKDPAEIAEKIYATTGTSALWGGLGGLALGAGGSLLGSGAKAAAGGAKSALARAMSKADEAATDLAMTREGAAMRDMLTPEKVQAGARGAADDLAFSSLGTTREISDKIGEEVQGGTRAVGNYVNRRILKLVGDEAEGATLTGTVSKGRADNLLPLIKQDKASLGAEIGDVVKANDVAVDMKPLLKRARDITQELDKNAATVDAGRLLSKKVDDLNYALASKGIQGDTAPLSELYYQRAGLESQLHEVGRISGNAAKEALSGWLRDVDATLVRKIDEVAKAKGGPGADKLLSLKRDYQLASAAEKAAEDGVDRLKGNNTFGPREGVGAAVGLATGHPLGAIAAGVGGKLLRERGSAAGAYLLSKVADSATVMQTLRTVDEQIGRSAKGLLMPPASGAGPYRSGSAMVRAQQVIRNVRQAQADPVAFAERLQHQTDAIAQTSPDAAKAYQVNAVRAVNYLASKIPPNNNTNPLRGPEGPELSYSQAIQLAQVADYVENPLKFFKDLERGKVTPEGADAIRTMMPKTFEQLQVQTLEAIADAKAKNKPIPLDARMRLSMLMDITGDASLRPVNGKLLQENVSAPPPKDPPSQGQVNGRKPLNLDSQSSKFDRLELR